MPTLMETVMAPPPATGAHLGGTHYVKKESEEEPVVIKLGNNKYKYGCANCNLMHPEGTSVISD